MDNIPESILMESEATLAIAGNVASSSGGGNQCRQGDYPCEKYAKY
jgi:hypothetical protein